MNDLVLVDTIFPPLIMDSLDLLVSIFKFYKCERKRHWEGALGPSRCRVPARRQLFKHFGNKEFLVPEML